MSLVLFFLGRLTAPGKQSGANEVSSQSLAELMLTNGSTAMEQEYFSDGLSEELLNQLAQIPQLRVIARTSSFPFKGKEVDVATIAKSGTWPTCSKACLHDDPRFAALVKKMGSSE